jgi:hypothetical protein
VLPGLLHYVMRHAWCGMSTGRCALCRKQLCPIGQVCAALPHRAVPPQSFQSNLWRSNTPCNVAEACTAFTLAVNAAPCRNFVAVTQLACLLVIIVKKSIKYRENLLH